MERASPGKIGKTRQFSIHFLPSIASQSVVWIVDRQQIPGFGGRLSSQHILAHHPTARSRTYS